MKKVSVTKWSKLLGKNPNIASVAKTITGEDQDQTIEIEIKTSISMDDRMSFSKDVCDACFDEVDNTYIPYAKEVSFKLCLLQYFTNIDPGKNIEKLLNFIEGTNVIHEIKDVIGESLYFALKDEVETLVKIEQVRRAKSTKTDALLDNLSALARKLSSMVDHAKAELEAGDMPNVAKILETYNADPEGMVKAILNTSKTN